MTRSLVSGVVSGKLPWDHTSDIKFNWFNYDNLLRHRGDGMIMEFGVSQGGTLGRICGAVYPEIVYGFDGFTGLPEDWGNYKKGSLAFDYKSGNWPKNSKLIVGLFQDTLDDFLAEHKGPIGYVHLDADLYSSTKFVLSRIKDRLKPGALLHFDEIKIMYGCDHEIRAFNEFLEETKTRWEIIGHNSDNDGVFKLL